MAAHRQLSSANDPAAIDEWAASLAATGLLADTRLDPSEPPPTFWPAPPAALFDIYPEELRCMLPALAVGVTLLGRFSRRQLLFCLPMHF